MQYFRQVKGWILERFHQFGKEVEKKLLKKGRLLESYCVTRPTGKMVKQATACTKQDIYLLMGHLYSNATVASDYQDAALLAFCGTCSAVPPTCPCSRKNVSVCSQNVLFVRFVRVKTPEEQGMTLFRMSAPGHVRSLRLLQPSLSRRRRAYLCCLTSLNRPRMILKLMAHWFLSMPARWCDCGSKSS